MVAHLEVVDTGADLDHLTGTLVAADDRELLDAQLGLDLRGHDHVTGDEMVVGMAETRTDELEHDLAGLGSVELDVLDLPVGVRLPQHGCSSLHVARPPPVRRTQGT